MSWILSIYFSNFISNLCIAAKETKQRFMMINPTLHGGGHNGPPPQHLGLWSLPECSEGSKILVQFLFYSDNGYSKCFEPKGCPKKNLEHVFWSRGQKSKVQSWSDWSEIFWGVVGPKNKIFLLFEPNYFKPLFPRYGRFKV